jgi:gliding motility-associated-like protein
VGSQRGYPNPSYQWQESINDSAWVDIPGATDTTLVTTISNPVAGVYQYRIGVLSSANSSLSCRIYSQPLSVFVTPAAAPLSPTTAVCAGQLLQLFASQGDNYQWTGPNGFSSTEKEPLVDKTAQPADSGIYTVTVSLNGCQSSSSTRVSVLPPMQPVVSKDTVICQGTAATLTAAQSQNVTTFSWAPSTGIDAPDQPTVTVTPAQTTTYTVTMGDGGCLMLTRQVTVTVLNKATASAGPNKHLMAGDSVKLNGSVSGDSIRYYWTPAAYLDNPNSLQPIASPPFNTMYTLHAQSIYNCTEDTSNVFIRVYQKLSIPNTFTPNNDGINDTWDIKNLFTYPACTVTVFDRYGQQVFQSYGYAKPWDGKNQGKTIPQGTYYYLIDLNNGMPKISGWLLIVH